MVAESTPTPRAENRPESKQRVLLVTGVLGAGKTTALRVLEDLGWEVIDNFPLRMLERLIDAPAPHAYEHAPLAIGFNSRTRGFNPHITVELVARLSLRHDIELTTLYLDCSGEELQRRYNETRRRHPLASDMPASAGISAEREVMEPLRRWADMVINTTTFSVNELQQAMREQFAPQSGPMMTVTVTSFGFSRGMPPVADFVFDMRFLQNPYWDPQLRPLTGKTEAVAHFIRADPAFDEAFARIRDLLLTVLPRFKLNGKGYVHIAFGCTGGRHRSVFMVEQMGAVLREAGFSPTLLHRNLNSRAADLVEGQAPTVKPPQ